jgi:hypothetical protein
MGKVTSDASMSADGSIAGPGDGPGSLQEMGVNG